MKKMPKIISVLILLLSVFIGFGTLANKEVHAAKNDATVILHKKMMDEFPDPLIQNTGMEMDTFGSYENYTDGVEFKVYDVTDAFYTRRAAGDTVDQAIAYVSGLAPTTAFRTGTTNNNGELSFRLPKKSGKRDAVYLFIETPKAGVTTGDNMVLTFPVYALDSKGKYTDKELNKIHLYPKNVVDADGSLIVKKKGTANNEYLNGAKFIIQSNATDRYLEGVSNGFFAWVDSMEDAHVFETGNDYNIGADDINMSPGDEGILRITGFTPGSYNLIEIEAPDNAAIIDANETTAFKIAAKKHKKVTLKIYNDTIKIDKEHGGEKVDYNVGDFIPYTAAVNIPRGMGDKLNDGKYKHPALIITDVPVAGLMFNNDLTVTINGSEFDITDLLTLETNGFTLTIPAVALEDFAGEDLVLSYNMYLDGTAEPDLGYNNTIEVKTELLDDEDETEDVFTGGKQFVKVDANFRGRKNTLKGAKFVVRNDTGEDAKYLQIGEDKAVSWVDDLTGATEFVSNNRGILTVEGLEYGTYWLEEVEAPKDYVLREELLEFTIYKGSFKKKDMLEVVNVRKGRLPSTGGGGIMGIVGVGVALVLTTGGYYYKRQRDQ